LKEKYEFKGKVGVSKVLLKTVIGEGSTKRTSIF